MVRPSDCRVSSERSTAASPLRPAPEERAELLVMVWLTLLNHADDRGQSGWLELPDCCGAAARPRSVDGPTRRPARPRGQPGPRRGPARSGGPVRRLAG